MGARGSTARCQAPHARHVLEASGEELASLIERLKARCAAAGQPIARVILTHEAGRDGFWLARFLMRRGVEVHVMQPSSLPVDRRERRAKTDVIDVEMLLRTLMAWLRGEPRVCSLARGHAGHRSRTLDISRARGFLAADLQPARARLLCRTCLDAIFKRLQRVRARDRQGRQQTRPTPTSIISP